MRYRSKQNTKNEKFPDNNHFPCGGLRIIKGYQIRLFLKMEEVKDTDIFFYIKILWVPHFCLENSRYFRASAKVLTLRLVLRYQLHLFVRVLKKLCNFRLPKPHIEFKFFIQFACSSIIIMRIKVEWKF